MLNSKTGERELVYVTLIDAIEPIEGSDNCECAVVGGWHVMVRKGEFKVNDVAIYFEIDSLLDSTNPAFAFMAKKHYKVKTQKYTFGGKGNFVSQGLLMSAANFGWAIDFVGNTIDYGDNAICIKDDEGMLHSPDNESRFLTKQLNVTYAVAEDNQRKVRPADKYEKMISRHKKLFSHQPFCFLIKHKIGRKFLFEFFGKKKDKSQWPGHICARTDVERIQNMPFVLQDKQPYVATEKVDGSSFTVAAERGRFGKIKYYVCSRNVVFENEDQKCYYANNIYWEAYFKYNLKDKITQILNDLNLPNVAIQTEIYGTGVQKRDYSLKDERRIAVFHIVSNGQKMPMQKVVEICEKYGLPHVPVLSYNYILPDTMEELQEFVEGYSSTLDNKEKEGIVFYDVATGQKYFKFVSPEYLIKYH